MAGRRSAQPNLQVKPALEIFHSLVTKTSPRGQPFDRTGFLGPQVLGQSTRGALSLASRGTLYNWRCVPKETEQGQHKEEKRQRRHPIRQYI